MTDDAVKNSLQAAEKAADRRDAIELALTAIDAAAQVDELTKPSLVERLRSTCEPGCKCTKQEAADRIEALERENGNLRRAKELFNAAAAQANGEADLLARALWEAFDAGRITLSPDAARIAERRVKGE